MFADSLSLFVLFFPVLLSPHFPRLLILSPIPIIEGEAGKKVSLHRLIANTNSTRGDNNFFFSFYSETDRCAWEIIKEKFIRSLSNFMQFYRVSRAHSRKIIYSRQIRARNSIIPVIKIIFFNQLYFPDPGPDPDRELEFDDDRISYPPAHNFFNPIYLCILWSQRERERVEMNIRFVGGKSTVKIQRRRSIDLAAIPGFSCRNRHFPSRSVISYFVPWTSLAVKEFYL